MNDFSHERPILVVLPERTSAPQALQVFLAHPQVRHHHLPPPWFLDGAGIDLPAALPEVACITAENVAAVLDAVLRLCDESTLRALVQRTWREVDERVRHHYLERTVLQTFAASFRVGTPSIQQEPTRSFVRDRIHEHAFEVQYRLAAPDGGFDTRRPDHEGSLVLYPFDPANAEAREEAGLDPGRAVVLEAFAYEPARDLHRGFLEGLAAAEGWTVVDPD